VRSIAFPAISTGAYGYPMEAATEIAVRTVAAHPRSAELDITFCCFDENTARVYRNAIAQE
jgi:O-acetyl-ADP-ribose deacetylase (regulator of RNase III)